MARKRLGEILVQAGVISESGLRAALQEQRRWGGPLGRILVDMGLVPEDTMVQALSRQLNLPMVRIEQQEIANSVIELIDGEMASNHAMIPFNVEGKFLDVAMSDPTNLGIIDELRIRTQLNVRPYLAGPRAISKALAKYYGKVTMDMVGYMSSPASGTQSGAFPVNTEMVDFKDGATAKAAESAQANVERNPDGSFKIRYGQPASRDDEISALQTRLSKLEALVARDEDVLRKVLGLMVEKGIATREEILERIK